MNEVRGKLPSKVRWTLLVCAGVLTVLLALMVLALGAPAALAGPGDPQPGTVQGVATYTFYPATAIAGSTVTYTTSPYTYKGLDVTKIRNWHSADVFLTVDVTGTATITVTPQFSADASNWVDAYYNYATWTTTGTGTINAVTYQIVKASDTTAYIRLPLAGEYMRFKIEHSDTVTPTIKVTLRND